MPKGIIDMELVDGVWVPKKYHPTADDVFQQFGRDLRRVISKQQVAREYQKNKGENP